MTANLNQKLLLEFKNIFKKRKYVLPNNTDGVIVFSGDSQLRDKGALFNKENMPETIFRIKFGIEMMKILSSTIPLYLIGTTEQMSIMQDTALSLGLKSHQVVLIDSGKVGPVNTKTQMIDLSQREDIKNSNFLVFITSEYHVPRLIRTADKYLKGKKDFMVIPVFYIKDLKERKKIIEREMKAIFEYAKAGDILLEPTRGLVHFTK